MVFLQKWRYFIVSYVVVERLLAHVANPHQTVLLHCFRCYTFNCLQCLYCNTDHNRTIQFQWHIVTYSTLRTLYTIIALTNCCWLGYQTTYAALLIQQVTDTCIHVCCMCYDGLFESVVWNGCDVVLVFVKLYTV